MKSALLFGLVCLQALSAQSRRLQDPATRATLSGPVLGFTFDGGIHGVRPILGVPGAALLGAPLELGFEVSGAVSSPRQNYVLVVAAEDGSLRVAHWTGSDLLTRFVEGAAASPDAMVVSPAGSAAALYQKNSGVLQIVSGLPEVPRILRQIDVSGAGSQPDSLAISDDGQSAVVSGEGGVLLFSGSAPARLLSISGPASALAFAPGGHDLLVATISGEVTLVRNLSSSPAYQTLAGAGEQDSAAAGVQFSRDGTRAFAAASENGAITIWNLAEGTSATASCGCAPTGLAPLNGPATFRLTEPSGQPLWVLDASTAAARILFVPERLTSADSAAASTRGDGQ